MLLDAHECLTCYYCSSDRVSSTFFSESWLGLVEISKIALTELDMLANSWRTVRELFANCSRTVRELFARDTRYKVIFKMFSSFWVQIDILKSLYSVSGIWRRHQ